MGGSMRSQICAFVSVLALGLAIAPPLLAGAVEDGNAGEDALNKGDNATAIRLFTHAINSGQLAGDDKEFAYAERGKAYMADGNFTAAIADLKRAVQLKPDDADAEHQLIEAENRLRGGGGGESGGGGRYARDDGDSNRESPQQAGQDASAGMAAFQRGSYHEAIDRFTRAIDSGGLNADDSELAYVSRGNAYVKLGDNAHALADLGKALHMNPSDQDAQAAVGQALTGVHAQTPGQPIDRATCKANWSSTGSFALGKTYTAFATYPTLSPLEAFAGAYTFLSNPMSAQYSGWSVSHLDLDRWTVSASDPLPNSQLVANIEIRVEPAGAGSKTTVVETLMPMMVSLDLQGAVCNFLAQVARG
jgi:tetratricopeptide (TPR) repeat protein